MNRVLFLSRYRDATMCRKVEYIAREPDVEVLALYPAYWKDDLLSVRRPFAIEGEYQARFLPMLGNPADPHRAIYKTLDFGMRAFHPDIIHAEEEPDSLAALQIVLTRRFFAPRARLVLHTWQNLDRPKGLHVRMVIKTTLAAADAICCANSEGVRLLRSWGFDRLAPIIPAIGVDTETFRPCPLVNRDAFSIGYVGRFVPEKGIDTLLEAVSLILAKRPSLPVRISLVGGGPEEQSIREQIARLHLEQNVEISKPMPPKDIARKLCDFDVLVLPSRTTSVWMEQLGRVLLEAMASGIPVVGSDSGAIPEVIDDAGLIFREGDAAGLSALLIELAVNGKLRSELRRKGLERAQDYSQEELARRSISLYRKLLSSGR